METMDKVILDNQVKLLKAMSPEEKERYMAFCSGMLAAKGIQQES